MAETADNLALLAAVIEAPADDLARLVYADWLEENGQPDRAEFTRVQVQLARMTERERQSPAGLALRQRQYAVEACVQRLLPHFTDLVADGVDERGMWFAFDARSTTRFCVRRGFVAEVECPYMAWMAGLGVLVSEGHPVERVRTGAAVVSETGERFEDELSDLLVAWGRREAERSKRG